MAEKRQSWKAGGSALDGQDPSRKTWGQTWHIVPQLHPAVTGVHRTGGGVWDRRRKRRRNKSHRRKHSPTDEMIERGESK